MTASSHCHCIKSVMFHPHPQPGYEIPWGRGAPQNFYWSYADPYPISGQIVHYNEGIFLQLDVADLASVH